MKKSIREIANYEAFKAHCMTEAFRYFWDYHDAHSTSDRDEDARAGMVYLLEEISNKMRAVSQMLDVAETEDLSVMVDDPFGYVKGYPIHGFEDMSSLIKKSNLSKDKKAV